MIPASSKRTKARIRREAAYARLTGPNKAMIWIAGVLLGNKDVKTQIQNPIDGVAKENLAELLDYLEKGG